MDPEYLHCAACRIEWQVSPEDPDSTVDDARQHAQRHHPSVEWYDAVKIGRPAPPTSTPTTEA